MEVGLIVLKGLLHLFENGADVLELELVLVNKLQDLQNCWFEDYLIRSLEMLFIGCVNLIEVLLK